MQWMAAEWAFCMCLLWQFSPRLWSQCGQGPVSLKDPFVHWLHYWLIQTYMHRFVFWEILSWVFIWSHVFSECKIKWQLNFLVLTYTWIWFRSRTLRAVFKCYTAHSLKSLVQVCLQACLSLFWLFNAALPGRFFNQSFCLGSAF